MAEDAPVDLTPPCTSASKAWGTPGDLPMICLLVRLAFLYSLLRTLPGRMMHSCECALWCQELQGTQ